jgi:phage shock protein A
MAQSNQLDEALSDIRVVWDNIRPQYNEAVHEMNVWQKVAVQALKLNREDLARAALQRKLNYKQRATDLKTQLDQLAKVTEKLIRNSMNLS